MRRINKLNLSMDLVLSNKYLEVIIQSLNPKILNVKADILFYKIQNNE